jgi:hypothetical protein
VEDPLRLRRLTAGTALFTASGIDISRHLHHDGGNSIHPVQDDGKRPAPLRWPGVLSVRGESGASVGQCVDEPIQFIFCNTYTSFAEANQAQATFIDQLVEFGVSNTKSPRCLLRTKDLRHRDLRQMTAISCGR